MEILASTAYVSDTLTNVWPNISASYMDVFTRISPLVITISLAWAVLRLAKRGTKKV